MLGAAVARSLRSAAGESRRFVWSVGGAICFSGPSRIRSDSMREPIIHPRAFDSVHHPRILRAAPLRVRAWTGRSAVSSATDTRRPRIATAGTHRTRVSVARLSRSRMWSRRALRALTRPVILVGRAGASTIRA
jgi:hypothetical protein